MAPLQPLGYTPESVEASCRYMKTEAYQCLQRVEESLAAVRTRYAKMFPKLPDEIRGWRRRAEAAAPPPDDGDLREYQRVVASHAAFDAQPEAEMSDDRKLQIAIASIPMFGTMIPHRIATLEYMTTHPPTFHFEVLQRMYALLASQHPVALQGVGNLSSDIADALYAADPDLPAWHSRMYLMLQEPEFMNGVTWPSNVGNALTSSETRV